MALVSGLPKRLFDSDFLSPLLSTEMMMLSDKVVVVVVVSGTF